MNPGAQQPFDFWLRLAEAEIARVWQSLPKSLQEPLREVPVRLESRPDDHPLDDGHPEDLLGLFEGPSHGDLAVDVSAEQPAIILFLENLRDTANDDPDAFLQEVRTTLLHEIGHYFGFNETDLEARDLG